jgi:hypothetical protein
MKAARQRIVQQCYRIPALALLLSAATFLGGCELLPWNNPAQAAYGTKVACPRGRTLLFPDFTLQFLGTRTVPLPQYPRGFKYYDFSIAVGDQRQTVSWTAGTGVIDPQEFTVAGKNFVLERGLSEKFGQLGEDDLVIWQVAAPTPTATISPTVTPQPTQAAQDLLAQQVADDLKAFPRPACQAGVAPGKEWDSYRGGLANALGRLFSDTRAQSLSLSSLASIFRQGSGLSVELYAGQADVVLASFLNSNCNEKIGGGASPDAPRDTVYVLNRHGGLWFVAQVAKVSQAIWAQDHWIVLVVKTQFGGGQEFDIWFVGASAGEWKYESKLAFTQLYSVPLPHLSADGSSVTLYSLPAACNLPKDSPTPNSVAESDYKWQNGQYQCIASRMIPNPTPTRQS